MLLLASLARFIGLNEHVPYLTRLPRHRPTPAPKAAVRVDRLHPFRQIAVFDLVLLALLAFGFEDEHLAVDKPREKIGAVLAHDALVEIGDFKAEAVVFDPGRHSLAVLQRKGIGGFPGAVVDADVDVGLCCAMAGLAGVPGAHLAGGADRMVAVEDRLEALAVFLADGIQDMLNDAAHVERDDESAAQVVLVEERRGDADAVGADELLHNADELGQQNLAVAPPGGFHLVEDIPRRLEDDALGAEFLRQAFQCDAAHLGHIRLAIQNGRQFGDLGGLGGVQFQRRQGRQSTVSRGWRSCSMRTTFSLTLCNAAKRLQVEALFSSQYLSPGSLPVQEQGYQYPQRHGAPNPKQTARSTKLLWTFLLRKV